MRQFKDYLPPELQKYIEFNLLGDSIDSEFNNLEQHKAKVLNNSFISTLDEWGCTKWEKMLHLVRRDSDSLEDRRKRILIKFLNRLPYTEKRLREMIESITGVGGYTLNVDIANECVRVRIALDRKNQYNEVLKMLEDVVPLNLWLDVQLMYNQHDYVGLYAHKHLGKFTHQQIKEEKLGIQEIYQKHIDLKAYKHDKLHTCTHDGVLEGGMINNVNN